MSLIHILSCFYMFIVHKLKIWYFCNGAWEAANILSLLVSRWEWSFDNISIDQFTYQYTPFHCQTYRQIKWVFHGSSKVWYKGIFERSIFTSRIQHHFVAHEILYRMVYNSWGFILTMTKTLIYENPHRSIFA